MVCLTPGYRYGLLCDDQAGSVVRDRKGYIRIDAIGWQYFVVRGMSVSSEGERQTEP